MNQRKILQPPGAIAIDEIDRLEGDRESIQRLGVIQPHGVVLALSHPHLTLVQVSCNIAEQLGMQPEAVLNHSLEDVIGVRQTALVRQQLDQTTADTKPVHLSIPDQEQGRMFNALLHRSEALIILELEPIQDHPGFDFFDFYQLVKQPITKLQNTATLSQLCHTLVQEIRAMTGFDRVMVYRFNETADGVVIAEDVLEGLEPFLGLHYPAFDVPEAARQLFKLNRVRLIPDAQAVPVGFCPAVNPITTQPLDLSLAVLRGVSPCHLEYLRNMGVQASLSISLMRDQQLWGLIACHHQSPKGVSYELRSICEILGQVASLELATKEDNEDLDYQMKLRSIQSRFVESVAQAEDFTDGLTQAPDDLLALVGAQGVVVCAGDTLTCIGNTPTEADIEPLMTWVEAQMQGNLSYHTNCLSQVYPAAAAFQNTASGILALSISKAQKTYLIWFRPEVLQQVKWGGDPQPVVTIGQDGDFRLSPRQSFALWQETVRSKSLPWKPCEIEVALELRSAIVSIVLRKADELARINLELERSNNELDAFAYIASHDLKEPLRGIHNYSSFLLEDYANILNEDGVAKLQTLLRLTCRMEDLIDSLLHFSRLGRVDLSMQTVKLDELVQKQVLDVLDISLQQPEVEIRMPRSLPAVQCDRVQVCEVFSNLISNAIKYNDKPDKWVEIGFIEPALQASLEDEESFTPALIFYVKDNGIGIRDKHIDSIFRIFKRLHAPNRYGGGTGAGLTIAKKIVERHGGKIWVESTYREGSTFYFTLQPSR